MVSVFMLVQPLWPIVEYVANYDYIVKVLCENKDKPQLQCNGKCYLAKQLEKQQENHDNNPFGEHQSKTEIQTMVYFQFLLTFDLDFLVEVQIDHNFGHYQDLKVWLFTDDIPHPPKQV